MRIRLPIEGVSVALDLDGAVVLEARRVLLSADAGTARDLSDRVGASLLLLGLPAYAALGYRAWTRCGGLLAMAGEALDLLTSIRLQGGAPFPVALVFPWAQAAASAVLDPEAPVERAERASEAPRVDGFAPLPDPYPGLTLDTGAGPEGWLAFAARTGNGRTDGAGLARWRAAAAERERGGA